jgi:hypothetical protein
MSAGARNNQAAKVSLSSSFLKEVWFVLVFCCMGWGENWRTAILPKLG